MQKLIRGIGIQPMLLLMGCLAPMVSLAAKEQGMTGDSGAGPIKKKLINRGWGAPSVEEFRDHIKEIDASPFDGTAIKFYLKDDEGKTVVVFGAGKNQPWKAEWYSDGFKDGNIGTSKYLEVELKPTRELRWPMEHEVVTLQLKTPVTTSAQNAGVWIKGNGSWGEVEIRKTASGGPWSTSGDILMRWPGNSTLNFDGWNLITYPSNGTVKKDNVVQGLQISLPRQTLYGTDMVPVENLKVRIKNLILF